MADRYGWSEKGSIARRGVNADAVEKPILEILKWVFGNSPKVAEMVRRHVERVLAAPTVNDDRERLVEALGEVKDRLAFIYGTASRKDREDPKTRQTIAQLQARRDEIDYQLEMIPVPQMTQTVTCATHSWTSGSARQS